MGALNHKGPLTGESRCNSLVRRNGIKGILKGDGNLSRGLRTLVTTTGPPLGSGGRQHAENPAVPGNFGNRDTWLGVKPREIINLRNE